MVELDEDDDDDDDDLDSVLAGECRVVESAVT